MAFCYDVFFPMIERGVAFPDVVRALWELLISLGT